MLREVIIDTESLYDILNATVDESLMNGVAESMLKFSDTNKIVLYTSLNTTNTKLLKEGKYEDIIYAFEYEEAALGESQSEYVIEIVYNTTKLFDTLHPLAYTEIENIIKNNKLKKSEVKDIHIVRELIYKHKFTGVRMHVINSAKKCYTKTHSIFDNSKLVYILNPKSIQINRIIDKKTKQVVWSVQGNKKDTNTEIKK